MGHIYFRFRELRPGNVHRMLSLYRRKWNINPLAIPTLNFREMLAIILTKIIILVILKNQRAQISSIHDLSMNLLTFQSFCDKLEVMYVES